MSSNTATAPLESLVTLPIKALTISQPFASLIADGSKWVENRCWGTSYRGPLAIHAGKGTQYLTRNELRDYPHGGIVAVATLATCIPLSAMSFQPADQRIPGTQLTIGDMWDHEHTEGPWCWILKGVKPCEFLPCRGSQGLWDLKNA